MELRLKLVALSLLILIMSSCSQGDKSIDQLIVAFDNSPRSFDPRFAIDANSQYLTNLLHCSLIEYTPEGGFQNQIASSIEWKNPKLLHIKLKNKVRFSNSQPLTAADVKATFDFLLNPEKSPRSAGFKVVDKIVVLNASELEFHFNKVDAAFIINNLGVGILPQSLAKIDEAIKDPEKLIGCGPYKLDSFKSHEIKLSQNGKFVLKNRVPRKNQLIIKIVKDEGTRFLKLRKGEVHLVQNISREKVAKISDYPKLHLQKTLGLNTAYLAFNMKDKVVGNKKVRQAIAYALNRNSIIKHILKGMAQPASQLMTPGSFYHFDSVSLINQDLEKAKKLLDEAGYKDPDGEGGKPRLVLQYKTTTDRTRVTIAKTIVTQLSKIGIKVNLQSLEWGKFKKDVEEGKAQLWSLKWVGFKDPDILHYAFHSSNHPPQGGNRGYYVNESLDKILDDARSIVDKNQRKSLYEKAAQILENDLPYIYLWHEEVFSVINNSLTGYEVYADGRYQSLPLVREKAN